MVSFSGAQGLDARSLLDSSPLLVVPPAPAAQIHSIFRRLRACCSREFPMASKAYGLEDHLRDTARQAGGPLEPRYVAPLDLGLITKKSFLKFISKGLAADRQEPKPLLAVPTSSYVEAYELTPNSVRFQSRADSLQGMRESLVQDLSLPSAAAQAFSRLRGTCFIIFITFSSFFHRFQALSLEFRGRLGCAEVPEVPEGVSASAWAKASRRPTAPRCRPSHGRRTSRSLYNLLSIGPHRA